MTFQVPEYIRTLVPYVPGKPIEETQREFGIKKVVKLASNENPLGISPKAKKAIQACLKNSHRYPDGGGFRLKQALSQYLDVSASSLILGNGSNEIIDMLIRTYCVPGDAIATPQYSFIAYKISAQVHGVQTLEAPVDQNMRLNGDDLLSLVRKNEKIRIVFVANPNNPTGTYLSRSEVQSLMRGMSSIRGGSVLLVMDYAYFEYVMDPEIIHTKELLNQYSNCVVLRTFSKIYGMAGVRAGYGVASAEIIQHLDKVRQPFNVNSLALAGAEAALSDTDFVKQARKLNKTGMLSFEKGLTKLGIPFLKSQGNSILVDVMKGLGKTGPEVYQACLTRGVIFRPLVNYQLPHALRITIGTPEENKRALEVLSLNHSRMGRKK